MGLYNTEIFNNLGLCSFYAQQFDVVVACFENALQLALNDNAADVWYNISHVAIVSIYCKIMFYNIINLFYVIYTKHPPFHHHTFCLCTHYFGLP